MAVKKQSELRKAVISLGATLIEAKQQLPDVLALEKATGIKRDFFYAELKKRKEKSK